jgi:hypothetical protein
MRIAFRVSSVTPGLCALALLFAGSTAKLHSQDAKPQAPASSPDTTQTVPQDQIHPITGLPLPPDDPHYVAPPPPKPAPPKPLTRAQKLAAARKAATEAANARIAAAKEAAAKRAADKAAAEKAAAEKLAANRAAAKAAAAKKAEAEKAAADKLAADRAAAAEKAAAEKKAAADKAAAAKAAADAAAAEKAEAAKVAAEKADADRAAARKAAADKLAADKAAAAEKAAAERKAAAEKAAEAKAAADAAAAAKAEAAKAAADKAAAEKIAADKLAADRAAAAEKAAAAKAAEEKAEAARAASAKAEADKAAAEKAAADANAEAVRKTLAQPQPSTPAPPANVTAAAGSTPKASPSTPAKSVILQPSTIAPSGPPPQPQPAKPAVAPAVVVAPSVPAPASGIGAIVFMGADPFTPAELAPITGLKIGSKPTSDSLQQAGQRLIDTGLFANISASYDVHGDVGTATFTVKPAGAADLVRASFANFVWLTPAEIAAALKPVAFYHGLVPTAGNLHITAEIEAALTAALKAKGINATITHALVPPSQFHSYPAMEFRVTDPDTVLETASLFDIPPTLVAKTLKAEDDVVKIPYNEGIAGTTLTDVLLAPARDAGYMGARLYRVEKKRKSMPSTVYIDYTARMEAGPIYTVRGLNWSPTPVLSAADFKRGCALQPGKLPTLDAISKTEAAIRAAYRAQGYMDAIASSSYKLNPVNADSGAIDYTFTVDPGPVYHLRTLIVHGLGPQAQKDFDDAWTMQAGDVYNEDYLLNFLKNHASIASLSGYVFDYDRHTTTDTHEVDLTLNFKPGK